MFASLFISGLEDVKFALCDYWMSILLAWQDISHRYKRSKIGAFWITINTACYIASLGLIFGTLFRFKLDEYLPNICAGVLTWNFISFSISESCNALTNYDYLILQVRIPFFTYIMRSMIRNSIIFLHNIIIFPIVCIITGYKMDWSLFYILLTFPLLVMNLSWISLVLAIVCARFRDIHQIIVNFLQIVFYATPIIWTIKILPANVSPYLVTLNPFYNFIELLRHPLLGESPTQLEWIFTTLSGIVGWVIALLLLGKYKNRIAYWM